MAAPRLRSARGAWRSIPSLAAVAAFLTMTSAGAICANPYLYVSPAPGSRLVSPHNNIVVRTDRPIEPGSVVPGLAFVTATRSGVHHGRLSLAADGRTIVFVPDRPFELGERVQVDLGQGPRAAGGDWFGPLTFSFTVGPVDPRHQPRLERSSNFDEDGAAHAERGALDVPVTIDALPPSYPLTLRELSNDPEPGHVFMTPNQPGAPAYGNLVVLDNTNRPIFYRRVPGRVANFGRQPNGLLTYFAVASAQFYALDSTYTVVDSFAIGNGYLTDSHELRLLPNGHALMMSYDPQPVGMDTVVAGGNPNATVVGLIIQEIDAAKNVVFQWRSWDHYEITDADDCVANLLSSSVDYAHGNAIEQDSDGHLMISARNMNEITKIDRNSGLILWRLGLNAKQNQFTFVDDTRGFSHQHDIRRLPNGNITLFDNGNCSVPEYSRALEYQLDEQNKVATLVWEYRNSPDTYGRATGNVQRRASGGTMVNWGFAARVTDLHPDGTKSMVLTFGPNDMQTYRALRFPWRTTRFETDVDALDFGTVEIGSSQTLPLTFRNDLAAPIEIDEFVSNEVSFDVTSSTPVTIGPGGQTTVNVRFRPHHPGVWNAVLHARAINDTTEVITQTVNLSGTATGTASADDGVAGGFALAPIPSPSRSTTPIAFTLPYGSPVKIRVVDVQGRVVAVLAAGSYAAGRHEVKWEGQERTPGLYFVRYEWPGSSVVRRLALLN